MPILNVKTVVSFGINSINVKTVFVDDLFTAVKKARGFDKELPSHQGLRIVLLKRDIVLPSRFRNSSIYAAYSTKGVLVGVLTVERSQAGSSCVLSRYIGKGIGLALYEAAFSNLRVLKSSTELSVGSSKLWKYLCEKHKGCVLIGGKRVAIYGFAVVNGFTIPKVKTLDGKIVTLTPPMDDDPGYGSSAKERNAVRNFIYEIRK